MLYQDSDNADSLGSTDTNEIDDENRRRQKRKKARKKKRYVPGSSSTSAVELMVGQTFEDKAKFKDALDNYRIVDGYNIKVIKSDKTRLQASCRAEVYMSFNF